MHGKYDALVKAAEKFIRRCENGEAKSVTTQRELREALAEIEAAKD